MERVDVAIIGSGPAGISAVLNAKIRNLSYIFFGKNRLSEKVERAEQILNYPGLGIVSGNDMAEAMRRHLNQMEICITEELVTGVYAMGDYFALTSGDKVYEAKTVILACGVETSKALKGEQEFLGRGVSYCATCDGNLYKGKQIAVLAYSKGFEDEVEYLADLADNVYFYPYYRNDSVKKENVQKLASPVGEIAGELHAQQVVLRDGSSTKVDGVFVLKESVSPAVLVPGIEMENGHIRVDAGMNTNLPGCFAAGDCTGRPYQYAKAVGEGNIALHSVLEYLNQQKKKGEKTDGVEQGDI